MIRAEKNLLYRLGACLLPHANFLGMDLGNEINCLSDFGIDINDGILDAWSAEMHRCLESVCPQHIRTNGVDHIPYFTNGTFSRSRLANEGNVTSLHTWVGFTGALGRYGYDTPQVYSLPEYMIELARANASDAQRPVWIQEFGASRDWMPEEAIPKFLTETVLLIASCENVWGVTWWCSHDVDERMRHLNHMEFALGQFDTDNRPKNEALAFKNLITVLRSAPPSVLHRDEAFVIEDAMFDCADRNMPPEQYPAWRIGDAFLESAAAGGAPTIVTAERAHENAYLRSRGIRTLKRIP